MEEPRRVALAFYRLARDGRDEELQNRLGALAKTKDKEVAWMYLQELPGDIYCGETYTGSNYTQEHQR